VETISPRNRFYRLLDVYEKLWKVLYINLSRKHEIRENRPSCSKYLKA
jgi:hypothetical protein